MIFTENDSPHRLRCIGKKEPKRGLELSSLALLLLEIILAPVAQPVAVRSEFGEKNMWKITWEIHKFVFSDGKRHVCSHVVKFSRKFTTRNMLKKHEHMVDSMVDFMEQNHRWRNISRWNLGGIPNENHGSAQIIARTAEATRQVAGISEVSP